MAPQYFDIEAAPGRFEGVTRPYTTADVQKLRGSIKVEQTIATLGANKLWDLIQKESYVPALGALSGNQVRLGPRQPPFPPLPLACDDRPRRPRRAGRSLAATAVRRPRDSTL